MFFFLFKLREATTRVEELETANKHLETRLGKLKTAKSNLLKDLWSQPAHHSFPYQRTTFLEWNKWIAEGDCYSVVYNSAALIFRGHEWVSGTGRRKIFYLNMENFSTRRWTTIPAPSVSYLVHESKKTFGSAVSASFLNLIYHGAGTVVHLLLLKGSMLCHKIILVVKSNKIAQLSIVQKAIVISIQKYVSHQPKWLVLK